MPHQNLVADAELYPATSATSVPLATPITVASTASSSSVRPPARNLLKTSRPR